jgi:hypothetical protein
MSKEVVPAGVLVSTAPAVAPELPPAVSPDVVVPSEDDDPVPVLLEPKVPMELTDAVPVVTSTLPSLEAAPPVKPLPDTAFALSRGVRSEKNDNFLFPFRPGVRGADCVNPSPSHDEMGIETREKAKIQKREGKSSKFIRKNGLYQIMSMTERTEHAREQSKALQLHSTPLTLLLEVEWCEERLLVATRAVATSSAETASFVMNELIVLVW